MSRKALQTQGTDVEYATATNTKEEEWLPHIKKVLGLLSDDHNLLNFGIYTVPARFKSSSDALSPRIVSIGHFHSGVPGLLAMQEQKLFYLTFLLHRTRNPVTTFDECCRAISVSDHFGLYARNFGYDSESAKNKLIEIMLIDGCFVLELLLRFTYKDMIEKGDVVSKDNWVAPTLRHDLLLLQSQIPKFVFKILVDKISRVSHQVPFVDSPTCIDLTMDVFRKLSFEFFSKCVSDIVHVVLSREKVSSRDRLHFLDMVHVAFAPPRGPQGPHRTVQMDREEKSPKLDPCTKLVAAGVKIEKADGGTHLLHLSFDGKTLKIPPLRVDLNTWSILKNLVVFEQCSVDRSHHVTSYAVVLRDLVRTKRDVELLEQKGILRGDLAKEYDGVLEFVECVESGMVIRDFAYQKLFDEVKAHVEPWWRWHKLKALWELSWHEYKVILRKQYFPHPWRALQIGVAFLILALTALQTVYTVLGYYP